jgi:hypothetical protein
LNAPPKVDKSRHYCRAPQQRRPAEKQLCLRLSRSAILQRRILSRPGRGPWPDDGLAAPLLGAVVSGALHKAALGSAPPHRPTNRNAQDFEFKVSA